MILQNIQKVIGMNRFISIARFTIYLTLQIVGILTGSAPVTTYIFIREAGLMKIPMPTGDFRRCYGIKEYGMISISGDLMLFTTGQHGGICYRISFITNFNENACSLAGFLRSLAYVRKHT